MKLEDFIRSCLKDQEFRKYWEEDNMPLMESAEELIALLERPKKEIYSNSSKDKKDWIPVERTVFVDDFSYLLNNADEESKVED